MNTNIAGAAIADPPLTTRMAGCEQAPAGSIFFCFRRRANPMIYPQQKIDVAARLAYIDAQIDNIRILPECYVSADADELADVLAKLKSADLDRQFTTIHLARAEAARTNACNILQAMLDGKRSAERKAWAHQ